MQSEAGMWPTSSEPFDFSIHISVSEVQKGHLDFPKVTSGASNLYNTLSIFHTNTEQPSLLVDLVSLLSPKPYSAASWSP